jgi:heat shock protein HslJ
MTGRRVLGLVVLFMAWLVLAGGCAGRSEPPTAGLAGTEWVLTSLRGDAPLAETEITLRFEDEFLTGTMGCNGYGGGPDSGEYTAGDGRLTVSQLAVTVQLCSEPAGVMEQEQAYISALLSAASYRVAGGRLEIDDAGGNTVLVFDRAQ